MPPKKRNDDVASSQSSTQPLEEREEKQLAEISKKLTLILSAIETLTETIINKEEQPETSNAVLNPTLEKISDALTNLTSNIHQEQQDTQIPSNSHDSNSVLVEEEALKIKSRISRLWEYKIHNRREAFWGKVKNEGLHE